MGTSGFAQGKPRDDKLVVRWCILELGFGEPEAKRQLVRTVRGAGRKWDGEKDREISKRGFFLWL
jgi:hypothetical protein